MRSEMINKMRRLVLSKKQKIQIYNLLNNSMIEIDGNKLLGT